MNTSDGAALREIMDAIESAPRCRRFYGADDLHPEPCDGLDGCYECLKAASVEVLKRVDEQWTPPS